MKISRLNSCAMLIAIATVFATIGQAQAGVMTYQIKVEVTAAPLAPGSFPSNPWTFGLPSTFVGTFEADDTAVGAISNLQLTIGGLDIASTHTAFPISEFDPGTMALSYQASHPTFESIVLFGSFSSSPSNYAVALEFDTTGTLDPFYGLNQNWVGSFSISSVPEPGSFAIFGAICLIACLRRRQS